MNVIHELEQEQIKTLTRQRNVPEFGPGDTLRVVVKVIDTEDVKTDAKGKKQAKKDDKPAGDTVRLQAYEGVCIARSGAGLNESFTVRKISYGEGVERVFPIYSPYIAEIDVLRRGKVRRAKLYYLRGRRGKAARILERTDARAKRLNAAFKGFKKPKGNPDDLKQIKGIDEELENRLQKLGVIKFEQIANFSDDDIANLEEALGMEGVVEKGNWVGEAQRLVAEAAAAEVPAEGEKKG